MPLLDLIAGIWNFNTWNAFDSDDWTLAYRVEIIGGVWGLISWLSFFQNDPQLVQVFLFTSRFHILVEAADLFLVYSAEDTWSNIYDGAT